MGGQDTLVGRNPRGFDLNGSFSMTMIRRYFRTGNIYFTTHVTHDRVPILVDNFDLLWTSIQGTLEEGLDGLKAWVVLPDHCHFLIDPGSGNLSGMMRRVKLSFSARYRKRIGMVKGRIWQFRFWDHIIRDTTDMNRHIDYIHYNPVKHGLVLDPLAYRYSSFQKFFGAGYYSQGWGIRETMTFGGLYGE